MQKRRQLWLYLTAGQVVGAVPGAWKELGLDALIVALKEELVYDPALTHDAVLAEILPVVHSARGTQVIVGIRCDNNQPGIRDNASHLVPWADNAAWEWFARNLVTLASALAEAGVTTVLLDAENGRANKRDDGTVLSGYQNPKIAWPPHPRAHERGRLFAKSLRAGGIKHLGHYCDVENTTRDFQSYRDFTKELGPQQIVAFEDAFFSPGVRTQVGWDIRKRLGQDTQTPCGVLWRDSDLANGGLLYVPSLRDARRASPGAWLIYQDNTTPNPYADHHIIAALGALHRQSEV